MSKSYSIKHFHLTQLQHIKQDIIRKQEREAKQRKAEALQRAHDADYQWEMVKLGCASLRGTQARVFK
jgi:hypothetical protein